MSTWLDSTIQYKPLCTISISRNGEGYGCCHCFIHCTLWHLQRGVYVVLWTKIMPGGNSRWEHSIVGGIVIAGNGQWFSSPNTLKNIAMVSRGEKNKEHAINHRSYQVPPDNCCICRQPLSVLYHQFFVVRKGCFEAVLGGRCRMACGGSFSLLYIVSLLPLSYIDRIKLLVLVFRFCKGGCCLWWLGGLLQQKSSW